jgi:hypothetical protein
MSLFHINSYIHTYCMWHTYTKHSGSENTNVFVLIVTLLKYLFCRRKNYTQTWDPFNSRLLSNCPPPPQSQLLSLILRMEVLVSFFYCAPNTEHPVTTKLLHTLANLHANQDC